MQPDFNEAIGDQVKGYNSAYLSMERLLNGSSDEEKADFLSGLHDRGFTSHEIMELSQIFRERAKLSRIAGTTDIVGTGGDGMNTINVSTAAALVASSLGIRIAKHGNFGATSNRGSADFLKFLGYNFEMSQEEAERRMATTSFAFVLAPMHNENFAKFAKARKMLPFKTVFNYLGPLSNPTDPDKLVLGVTNQNVCDLYVDYLRLRSKKGFVIFSKDGMDEISPFSPSTAVHIDGEKTEALKINPRKVTGEEIRIADISNVEPAKSFFMTIGGLKGANTKVSKFIALNTALVVTLEDDELSFEESYELALKEMKSGTAYEHTLKIVEDSR